MYDRCVTYGNLLLGAFFFPAGINRGRYGIQTLCVEYHLSFADRKRMYRIKKYHSYIVYKDLPDSFNLALGKIIDDRKETKQYMAKESGEVVTSNVF